MKIVICLPTKNEKNSIRKMINDIKALGLDLLIVDELSEDGTIEIAREEGIKVYQRGNKGKGWGVRKALEVAKEKGYDVLVMIDCDYSYPVDSIPRLVSYLPEYDMVVGKRDMHDIQFLHRLVNIIHTNLINLFFAANLSDINSGLRVLKIEKFKDLILTTAGFDIEAQITTQALKNKLKIKEVPISYRKRIGKSKIKAKDTFTIIRTILKERFKNK